MNYYQDDRLIATHLGDDYQRFEGAVVPPIFMNSLHVFPTIEDYINHDKYSDFVYGRVSNPTVRIVEEKIATMERAAGAAVCASGMAAFTTAVAVTCKAGSHIICLRNCYGPVVSYLNQFCIQRLGMQVSFVDDDADAVLEAIRPETSLIILESPTSLVFHVVDIEKITRVAREKGIYTYLDNTYCTPLFQKPLEMGVDLVMHTLSKYLGGHSDLIGGVLCSNNQEMVRKMADARELYGGTLGPQEAWLVMRGIRTLDVRLRRHQETALRVARFLEEQPRVKKVYYPGLPSDPGFELAHQQQQGNCGLLSFEIDGTREQAAQLCNRLELFQIGVSWGGFESLAVMPMYTKSQEEAAAFGASNALVRIHCGLEGADNLIVDLKQAIKSIG